ncbi:hypothetical protein F5X68DRAFT_37181 [Plectosphaerella plurivora]|uniref:Uncharacterized protein n=1 Tax=Plectosphaerella plurivora TaxID=936078 RepID=A0A9P8V7C0_9PEZI|nr:hypothetical protein F5X68DRAFT_37181 [Plectosphaerella plurivora]
MLPRMLRLRRLADDVCFSSRDEAGDGRKQVCDDEEEGCELRDKRVCLVAGSRMISRRGRTGAGGGPEKSPAHLRPRRAEARSCGQSRRWASGTSWSSRCDRRRGWRLYEMLQGTTRTTIPGCASGTACGGAVCRVGSGPGGGRLQVPSRQARRNSLGETSSRSIPRRNAQGLREEERVTDCVSRQTGRLPPEQKKPVVGVSASATSGRRTKLAFTLPAR